MKRYALKSIGFPLCGNEVTSNISIDWLDLDSEEEGNIRLDIDNGQITAMAEFMLGFLKVVSESRRG